MYPELTCHSVRLSFADLTVHTTRMNACAEAITLDSGFNALSPAIKLFSASLYNELGKHSPRYSY
jgi:hypothetical protein